MAGDWIKWVKGLTRRPEVFQIAANLGRSRHEVAALLMELWEWADDNVVPDDTSADCPGFVRNVSASKGLIDALVGVPGFADSLTSAGWINIRTGLIEFPKFGRHNGKSAKRRALEAERKRTSRANRPDSVRKMSASKADKIGTREEERRDIDPPTEDLTTPLPPPARPPPRKARLIFVPPTISEVAAYCRERSNSVDPAKFVAYYTSNGWRVGRNPMKDWKAAVLTWEKNSYGNDRPSAAKPTNREQDRLERCADAINGFLAEHRGNDAGGVRESDGRALCSEADG